MISKVEKDQLKHRHQYHRTIDQEYDEPDQTCRQEERELGLNRDIAHFDSQRSQQKCLMCSRHPSVQHLQSQAYNSTHPESSSASTEHPVSCLVTFPPSELTRKQESSLSVDATPKNTTACGPALKSPSSGTKNTSSLGLCVGVQRRKVFCFSPWKADLCKSAYYCANDTDDSGDTKCPPHTSPSAVQALSRKSEMPCSFQPRKQVPPFSSILSPNLLKSRSPKFSMPSFLPTNRHSRSNYPRSIQHSSGTGNATQSVCGVLVDQTRGIQSQTCRLEGPHRPSPPQAVEVTAINCRRSNLASRASSIFSASALGGIGSVLVGRGGVMKKKVLASPPFISSLRNHTRLPRFGYGSTSLPSCSNVGASVGVTLGSFGGELIDSRRKLSPVPQGETTGRLGFLQNCGKSR
ncbi:unnamed protein product [Protopolystoma xenopodis]|uniref:Uncharacterized protein n=1 Tax=Protopolystoma xenopodis TaxID=117903 RepID=A0A3S4ZWQ8_9PLAT|nr:unnamed protein product [Protopolystoma xenopodis]